MAGAAHGARPTRTRAAGLAAGVALLAVYALTAAPDVTFWDAGEFIAAFASFGVPHPPGTPLFVALGRVWTLALGAAGVGAAPAAALFSAACTAAAGGVTAALLARWTGSSAAGVAGALCAGGMSTAWANATEPEVYAPALLLALLALLAGDVAGRRGDERVAATAGTRATVLAAYLLALAVPMHLSALVAAPAAVWLAAARPTPGARGTRVGWARCATLGGTTAAAAGAGTGRPALALAGLAVPVAVALWQQRSRAPARAREAAVAPASSTQREALGAAAVTALAAGALVVLLVRARHDPWLNQGDPSTWAALVDAVSRRQYAPARPWPRQAPWWLQLANLGEWADWQVALGLDPGVAPGWRRTPVTVAFAALGAFGAAWHRRRDRRSFRAWALLLAFGGVGVAAYLNLKAGPSFGAGVLADGAPREARERDYFFVLAWWAWGAWAGLGAVLAARRASVWVRAVVRHDRWSPRVSTIGTAAGLALAAVPIAANWRVASRRREPDASTAGAFARALLRAAPPRAVLLVRADNDTYPLWAVQAAEGLRPDVTPVTLSLLPAAWYRRELARRHGLLTPAQAAEWRGGDVALRALAAHAATRRRPLATALSVEPAVRAAVGGRWAHAGLLIARAAESRNDRVAHAAAPPALAARLGVRAIDTAAVRAAAAGVARAAPGLLDARPLAGGDGVAAWARRQLACPAALIVTPGPSALRHTAASEPAAVARVEGACEAR